MGAPTTSIIEPFTGTGALSASWTTPAYTGDAVPERFNNAGVAPSSVYASALYNAAVYDADSEIYSSQGPGADSSTALILWLKVKNPNTGTSCNYGCTFHQQNNTINFMRQYNGADSAALGQVSFTHNGTQKYYFTAYTSGADIILEAWVDSGAGWVLRNTYTDVGAVSAYPLLASAGGQIAFAFYGGGLTSLTRSIDDLGGGSVITVAVDNCLPDADVTTTGWTTAPLFSKVNDASDATVIQATAV